MSPLYHEGHKIDLAYNKTLFDYADKLKIRVPTSCGRNGDCHECIVEVKTGSHGLNLPGSSESFLKDNYRLACQAKILDIDTDIEFSVLRRQPQILTHATRRPFEIAPLTTHREGGVYYNQNRIDEYRGGILGVAVDLGTTTVAINLSNLETGDVIATTSFENPQRFGGSDIMHRISYDGGEYKGELKNTIISAINFEIGEMTRAPNLHRRLIYEIVIVGNTTMRDILFGINVETIGEKPYKSITELEMEKGLRQSTSLNVPAKDLGLRVFPNANVYGGPILGCHVGADIAADLLTIAMDQEEENVMLVDIGTNTEVIVGNRHRMLAASCPAGPAFEGGEVKYGMPGYNGAVESIQISKGQVNYTTIGDGTPQGICGSGLVDLLAELRKSGTMTELGALKDGEFEFFFVPENSLSISRKDISALAQAKSANFSGQFILLRNARESIGKINKLYLSGGFANFIDVENAKNIGFIADIPSDRVVKVGNASLEGATIMLLSGTLRNTIERLILNVEHVELETTPDFFDIFVEGCMFKPMIMPSRDFNKQTS